jgi:hypothetical protein
MQGSQIDTESFQVVPSFVQFRECDLDIDDRWIISGDDVNADLFLPCIATRGRDEARQRPARLVGRANEIPRLNSERSTVKPDILLAAIE